MEALNLYAAMAYAGLVVQGSVTLNRINGLLLANF